MAIAAMPRSPALIEPISSEEQDWQWSFISELTSWREWMSVRGRDETTIKEYESCLLWFWLRGSRQHGYAVVLRGATQREIVSFLSTITVQGGHRTRFLLALRSYYKWAMREGLVRFDPSQDIPVPRQQFSPAPTLGIEDVYKVFLCAWEHHPRRGWAVLLMYATGGRLSAMCHLTAEDCSGGWCFFRVAKGNKPYRVPLSEAGEAAVQGLKDTAPPRKQNHVSPWRQYLVGVSPGMLWAWINEAGREAGINVHPHLIRHAFATEHRKIHPRTWQALMGHQDLGQYARYAHVDEAEMRAALEQQGRGES